MLKKVFIMLLMAACAKQVPSTSGIHKIAGDNFLSTNSPCMDGVLVAIDHSCSVPMVVEEKHPYIMIQCEIVRDGENPWHKYNIIAIIDPSLQDPPGATMMCMDPYARIYIQRRP